MTLYDAAKPKTVRAKYIDLTPNLILDLLRVPPEGTCVDGSIVKITGELIPYDARGVRVGFTENGDVRLVVESESFAPVMEGDPLSRLNLNLWATPLADSTCPACGRKPEAVGCDTPAPEPETHP